MKKLLPVRNSLFLFLMLCQGLRPAQATTPTFTKEWDYRYGGTLADELEVLKETHDGGFILGGTSESDETGDKSEPTRGGADYWVVKTDAYGIKQWDARFGGSLDDEFATLAVTSDGGYILGGTSSSPVSGDKTQANWDTSYHAYGDYWIVKIDASGHKQWDKRFGGIYQEDLTSVVQTLDGGYLLGGYSESFVSGDKSQGSQGGPDFWIVKTDANGNKLWDKRFGGNRNDQLHSLQQTRDGGYILAGYTWSDPTGDITGAMRGTAAYCDYWIVKIDAYGNKLWDKRYGGSQNDNLVSIIQCDDNGYFLGGYSYSGISGDKTQASYSTGSIADFWVIRVDANGNILWDRDLGGTMNEDEFGNVMQTEDKGLLVCGSSYSGINGTKTEANLGPEQSWLLKLDQSGNLLWDKTFFTPGHDEGCSVVQCKDGGYVIANMSNGNTGGYKTEDNRDAAGVTGDYWIVKINDNSLMPVASLMASSQGICSGTCISFDNHSRYGGSFKWIFNGAVPSVSYDVNPASVCYSTPGVYDVTLIATNVNGSDTLVLPNYIHVFQSPAAININVSGDTMSVPNTFTSYQWFLNGIAIPGAMDANYVSLQNGHYEVFVSDENGCGTNAAYDMMTTTVEHIAAGETAMNVYPNPSAGEFTVEFNLTKSSEAFVEVLNAVGQVVYSNVMMAYQGSNKMDIAQNDFAAGIYHVRILTQEKTMMKQISIEKK
ncbi:MAG: T9SS type A sorting domain-containing protein [Bacteroidia bacterium]